VELYFGKDNLNAIWFNRRVLKTEGKMTFYISRYKNMNSVGFDLKIVTPMFLGGANITDAELRVPSIKGMLRFWWRATCGIESLEEMKKMEAEIFGSTEQKASFSIQVVNSNNINSMLDLKERGEKFKVHGHNVNIIDYLSYGTHKPEKGQGNVYFKQYITPDSSFSLKFQFYNNELKGDLLRAFYFFIAYGGLGSRNRNGFGSLHIKNNDNKMPVYDQLLLSSFSAFSTKAKLFTFAQKNTWHEALSKIGMAYKEAKLCIDPLHSYNNRKLVVAPITVKGRNEADLDRHAKPYYLHVNKLKNGNFQGQILFMPYNYLAGHKNYSKDKLNNYLNTCEKMNAKLSELLKVQI
jgi:CRISPR-associated protein Cmr1